MNRMVSVAPMMDWTDRHERYFLRLFSGHILLYTEMITTGAIIHGDREYLLGYHPLEHPVALQIGGSDPEDLAECARVGEAYGYDEINLNLGCPSDRVKSGNFGACLMAEPALVSRCVEAMQKAVQIPVTVKTRTGIDDQDSYGELHQFVENIAGAGCEVFIIHARKVFLEGLSPKENREIPPLRYDMVHDIKRDFPKLTLVINGGIRSIDQIREQLELVDGTMIGREAYENPYFLASVDQEIFGDDRPVRSRHEIVEEFEDYMAAELEKGVRFMSIARHLMGLFKGVPGARSWRRHLGENGTSPDAGVDVLRGAARFVPENA
tara:strand:- start:2051 stop:3019 length:969 start_codon:yes stop_codon:yes gene_type:complete